MLFSWPSEYILNNVMYSFVVAVAVAVVGVGFFFSVHQTKIVNKTSLLHIMADEDVENQLMFTSTSSTDRMHLISFSRYKPCRPSFVFAHVTIKLFKAL